MSGKLTAVEKRGRRIAPPNGTGFNITVGPAPSLDATSVIVGEVVDGLDAVREISSLPAVKANDSGLSGGLFALGKGAGDPRAKLVEKSFNSPFQKVLVTKARLAVPAPMPQPVEVKQEEEAPEAAPLADVMADVMPEARKPETGVEMGSIVR